MKALAEQIEELDVEIYGRVLECAGSWSRVGPLMRSVARLWHFGPERVAEAVGPLCVG